MRKIKANFIRTEGSYAILSGVAGEEIKIPRSSLPNIKKGTSFCIDIKTAKEAASSDKELAKEILNEILRD